MFGEGKNRPKWFRRELLKEKGVTKVVLTTDDIAKALVPNELIREKNVTKVVLTPGDIAKTLVPNELIRKKMSPKWSCT